MSLEQRCDLLAIDVERAEALRRDLPSVSDLEVAAQRGQALADPTRLRIALALAQGGELCVCDVAWIAERQDKIVSHHLRLLRQSGLARSRRDGRMVLYSLTASGQQTLTALVGARVA